MEITAKKFFMFLVVLNLTQNSLSILRKRHAGNVGVGHEAKGVYAPPLGAEIDLEQIEGVEQVTKLVLIKTDSLPEKPDEGVDGRYLNSLMETLYTGLRKPFKSVSADILGIFPSFEEIQVRCDSNEHLEREEQITIKRSLGPGSDEIANTTISSNNDSATVENDATTRTRSQKSSLQTCKAVTEDCLSMNNLVQILPPTVNTFDQALVRLCPVMLFRIMNNLCDKSSNLLSSHHQDELISAHQTDRALEEIEGTGHVRKDPINLNTLLRETQILKNLQTSDELSVKRPQKLHKKLKTQVSYKNNGRLSVGGSQQHGSVDEQLLKIRLKLTEPSIEKVWIFSLLFVILSIVVSMGGLIVLPFVKKTTRRRILTLFEGLAVGGLAGSATLHMFPQAFGLVDENYHKYFWRIFVVFLGIYLCYLCERVIKILKVMRARIKRRSRASLIDMDRGYNFPSFSDEFSKSKSRSSRFFQSDSRNEVSAFSQATKLSSSIRNEEPSNWKECSGSRHLAGKNFVGLSKLDDPPIESRSANNSENSIRWSGKDIVANEMASTQTVSKVEASDLEFAISDTNHSSSTRQRLIHCLKSVQRQFSPVYAVQTQDPDETMIHLNDRSRKERPSRQCGQDRKDRKLKTTKNLKQTNFKRNRVPLAGKLERESKPSVKKYMKQREIETMLHHRRLMGRGDDYGEDGLYGRYLQQTPYRMNDVAAERHDQDNAARMSVDTVAWMIVFGDAVLNVIDGLSIGAAFERNILAGISISVAVMLEEVTHRLGTFAVLIRAGMSMQQSLLCTFLSACALFPGLVVGILLSDATEDATPYIFCAAGGIFLYMALVDVMKEMNRSIENAIRKDLKSTLQIFALQNVGIVLAVIFLSFLALYEQAMDFEEYQIQYNQPS